MGFITSAMAPILRPSTSLCLSSKAPIHAPPAGAWSLELVSSLPLQFAYLFF